VKHRPVTVVVLSKYREVLEGFLDSIKKSNVKNRIVIVADGHQVLEFMRNVPGQYTLIEGPEKFSMAGNANLGLKAVPKDHDVLYVGDDVRFLENDTIERLQQIAYFNPKIGILSPKLLGRSSPALANPPHDQTFTYVRTVEFWFPCIYIKREVIEKVGYLDERFCDFGADDFDYCVRVQQAGYKLAVTPRVTVQHEASAEGGPTTFVKNIGVDEWQRQQGKAWEKVCEKYKVDVATLNLFLQTDDLKLLSPSAVPEHEELPSPTRNVFNVEQQAQSKSLAQTEFAGQGKRGLAGKSLFVMTPMYGGQCTLNFVVSFLALIEMCRKFNVQMEYMFLHNESLITRARNRMMDYWRKKSTATHAVFIDADIGFQAEDIMIMLDLDLDVAGLPCVKKAIRLDRVQALVKKNGRDYTNDELMKVSGDFILNFEQWTGRKTFNLGEPQRAHSVGTGVMMIARRVMDKFVESYPNRYYIGNRTDAAALEGKIWDFFQVGVNPESQDYDSEDYRFCIDARKIGFSVWVLPWAQTSHCGTHMYVGDLPTMSKLMPEWAR
jgi:hypothetical protein